MKKLLTVAIAIVSAQSHAVLDAAGNVIDSAVGSDGAVSSITTPLIDVVDETVVGDVTDAIDNGTDGAISDTLNGIADAIDTAAGNEEDTGSETGGDQSQGNETANSGIIDIAVSGEIVPTGAGCVVSSSDSDAGTSNSALITFNFGEFDFGDQPATPAKQEVFFSGCDGDEVRFRSTASSGDADAADEGLLVVVADNGTVDTTDDTSVNLTMTAFLEDSTSGDMFKDAVTMGTSGSTPTGSIQVDIAIPTIPEGAFDGAFGSLSTVTNIDVIFE